MSLKRILKKTDVVSCEENASVFDVAQLMKDRSVGTVIVCNDGKPTGMITDRDLVLRCLAHGSESMDARATDVMTTPVETVNESAGIYEIISQMNERGIRRVCVVSDDGVCTNVVSSGDIIELLAREMGHLVEATQPTDKKILDETRAAS